MKSGPVTPTIPAAKHACVKHILPLLLFLATATGWFYGYRNMGLITGDQQHIGVMVKKDMNPKLYARDTFFSTRQMYQFYTPFYRKLIATLTRVTGDVTRAHKAMVIPLNLIYMCVMYAFILHFTQQHLSSALVSAISTIPMGIHISSEVYGIGSLPTMLPRTLFLAFFPFTLLLYYKFHETQKPSFLLGTFFIIGSLSNINPPSAFTSIQLFVFAYLITCKWTKAHLTTLSCSLALFILPASPFILHYMKWTRGNSHIDPAYFPCFVERMSHNLYPPLPMIQHLPAPLIHFITAVLLLSPVVLVFLKHKKAFLTDTNYYFALYIVSLAMGAYILLPMTTFTLKISTRLFLLPVLAYGFILMRKKQILDDSRFRTTIIIAISIFYVAIAGTLLIQWTSNILGIPIPFLDQLRTTRFFPAIIYIFTTFALSDLMKSRHYKAPVTLLLSLMLLSGIITKIRTEGQIWKDYQPFLKVAAWAKHSTPESALFLVDSVAFRFYSERSLLLTRKDGNIAYYTKDEFSKWCELKHEIENQSRNIHDLVSLAQKYHVDYLVLDRHIISSLKSDMLSRIVYKGASNLVLKTGQ